MFRLIIDNREKYVIRHTDVIAQVNNSRSQLTVGDYVITYRDTVDSPERVFAVFERKSLEDYAASMKDGRSDNKNKLLQLRDETGCKIFYIIEGAAFPAPIATFARTPYYYIQSSIFHLQVEYDIGVIQTRDTLHTAETLVAFMRSMHNLSESRGAFFKTFHLGITGNHRVVAVGANDNNAAIPNDDVMAILTAPRPRTDNEILRAMWACFKSITVESASEFMYVFSLSDLFNGKITAATLGTLKTSTGRNISKRVVESLLRRDAHRDARILACIPGISESRAKDILKQYSMRQLISYPAGAISIIKVGISRKNLGEVAAENILKYMQMKPSAHGDETITQEVKVDLAAAIEPNVATEAPTPTKPPRKVKKIISARKTKVVVKMSDELV